MTTLPDSIIVLMAECRAELCALLLVQRSTVQYFDKTVRLHTVAVDDGNRVEYRFCGMLHCDDGPAVIQFEPVGDWTTMLDCTKINRPRPGPEYLPPLPRGVAEIPTRRVAIMSWYRFGRRFRRNDEPDEMHAAGEKRWHQHWDGKSMLHRDNDLPALIREYHCEKWYQHGRLHRENGPAYILWNGDRMWFWHGDNYRPNGGPHIEWSKETSRWLKQIRGTIPSAACLLPDSP